MKNIFKRKESQTTSGAPKEEPTKTSDANRPRITADTQFTNFLKGITPKSEDKTSTNPETKSDLKKTNSIGFVQSIGSHVSAKPDVHRSNSKGKQNSDAGLNNSGSRSQKEDEFLDQSFSALSEKQGSFKGQPSETGLKQRSSNIKRQGTNELGSLGSGDLVPLKSRPSVRKAKDAVVWNNSSDELSGFSKNATEPNQLKARPSTIRAYSTNSRPDMTTGSMEFPSERNSDESSSERPMLVRRGSSFAAQEVKARLEKQRQEIAQTISPGGEGSITNLSKLKNEVKRRDSMSMLVSDALGQEGSSDSDSSRRGSVSDSNTKIKIPVGADKKPSYGRGTSALADNEDSSNSSIVDMAHNEIEKHEAIRQRWKSAIEAVRRALGTTSAMNTKPTAMQLVEESKKSIMDGNTPSEKSSNTMTGQLSSMSRPVRKDNHQSKVIEILSKPIFYRSAEQLYALDLILRNFPGMGRYSKNLRMKLVEKGSLLELGPYRVIVRQGTVPWSIYFLISGKCQSETIVVNQGQGIIRRRDILPGEAFGEFGLLNEGARRSETVFSATHAVMLSVPRDIYVDLMRAEVMANKQERIELLRGVGALHSAQLSLIERLLSACQIYRYEPNVPLLRVGERETITIILEGQCRANRLVPFTVKSQSIGKAVSGPEITGAYIPGQTVAPGEEVIYQNLSVGMLGPGDFFPRITLLRSEGLEYRLQKIDLEKIIILMNGILKYTGKQVKLDKTNIGSIFNQHLDENAMDLEDSIAGVDLSVTSVDKVTCLVITKMDLATILPEDILSDITSPDYEGLVGIPIEEIQQNYFEKIQWKGYRKEVMMGVVQGVADKKGVTARRK